MFGTEHGIGKLGFDDVGLRIATTLIRAVRLLAFGGRLYATQRP